MDPTSIVTKNSQLEEYYQHLERGQLVACILRGGPFLEQLMVDLLERGVKIFPSCRSQLATRSKCFQAILFSRWMVPETRVISCKRDLVRAIEAYGERAIGPVITKLDRSDCGLGINKWPDVESLFNQINFCQTPPYPFVLQPFLEDAIDIRVVWIGDKYLEAYTRKNAYSFRNNMHFGGESIPYELSSMEKSMCREVMERGGFPFAHMDLLRVPGQDRVYLSEISLFGGLKGARITQKDCEALKRQVVEEFIQGQKG